MLSKTSRSRSGNKTKEDGFELPPFEEDRMLAHQRSSAYQSAPLIFCNTTLATTRG